MDVYCGIDWAEDHHDIALVDRDGNLLARRRVSDDAAGLAGLLALLAGHGDSAQDLIPVAIETPRGLLVACLRATGRQVYPINPMSVARYRDRHSVAGKKSDHGDSVVLANVLRTDLHAHRPLPADTELAQAIAVLARAQQDAVLGPHHRAQQAPLPPARVLPRLPGRFRRGQGRHHPARGPGRPGRRAHARRGRRAHRGPAARPAAQGGPQQGHRHRGRPAARGIPACRRCASFPSWNKPWAGRPWPCSASSTPPAPRPRTSSSAVTESFNLHPDAGIITSFPGLGALTGARVLAEIGDDRSRFQDAKGLKAYAGAAPITRASGKTRSVTLRRIKNNRLNAAGYIWAFSALTASPGARAHYDRRRDAGDRHAAAQRNLFGRLLGCLHHCLTTGQHYDETIAFPAAPEKLPKAA